MAVQQQHAQQVLKSSCIAADNYFSLLVENYSKGMVYGIERKGGKREV